MVNDMANDRRIKLFDLIESTPGVSVEAAIFIADHLIANGVTVPVPAESKPPVGETVLGYAQYHRAYIPLWIEVCWTGEKWIDRGGLRLTVTYWMPLPRLPENGG